jgi:hypothetical protein
LYLDSILWTSRFLTHTITKQLGKVSGADEPIGMHMERAEDELKMLIVFMSAMGGTDGY